MLPPPLPASRAGAVGGGGGWARKIQEGEVAPAGAGELPGVPGRELLLDVGGAVGQLLEPHVVLQHEVEVEQVVVRYRGAGRAGFPQLGREVPDIHLDAGAGEEVDDA